MGTILEGQNLDLFCSSNEDESNKVKLEAVNLNERRPLLTRSEAENYACELLKQVLQNLPEIGKTFDNSRKQEDDDYQESHRALKNPPEAMNESSSSYKEWMENVGNDNIFQHANGSKLAASGQSIAANGIINRVKRNLLKSSKFVQLKRKAPNLGHSNDNAAEHWLEQERVLVRKEICKFLGSFVLMNKMKFLFILMNLLTLFTCFAQAGFWTFYLPNFLKPSGYNELTDLIKQREAEINSIKDNYSDVKYFWTLMTQIDGMLEKMSAPTTIEENFYPEEDSVCSELFPMFRSLAIDYAKIDFEHYMKPLELQLDYLVKRRSEWFPEGEKSKNILPREWEQQLYENDLLIQIEWLEKLALSEEFKGKRQRMVDIWKSVKRSLDSSLACVYLKYAYRQVSEDINQLALEMNLKAMKDTLAMVQSAYKNINKFANSSDQAAKQAIIDAQKKKSRFEILS